MVTSQRKGSQVHHFQFFLQHFTVGQLLVHSCSWILRRVSGKHTVNFGCFQHHIGFNFDTTQASCRVSGEEWVTSTGREDHHTVITQQADSFGPTVAVTHAIQWNSGHQTSVHIGAVQCITHCQAVHHGRQHAHVVAHNAVHTRFRQTSTTEQVTPTNHHTNLNTQFNQFFDFLSHAIQYACINTEAFSALQSFAT